jgi:hypothetical protein
LPYAEVPGGFGGFSRFTICGECPEAGQSEIDDRLEIHAEALEAVADVLRDLTGRLKLPTLPDTVAVESANNNAINQGKQKHP